MKYRTITVKTPGGEADVRAFKRALLRAAAPHVRIAESGARQEVSATIPFDTDTEYVRKCVGAMGLEIIHFGEAES